MAVTACKVEPLDHARFEVGGALPGAVLVGLPAVVGDDLAGPNGGRELGGGDEDAHVVVDLDLFAVVDAQAAGVVVVEEDVGPAAGGLLQHGVVDVHGVGGPRG